MEHSALQKNKDKKKIAIFEVQLTTISLEKKLRQLSAEARSAKSRSCSTRFMFYLADSGSAMFETPVTIRTLKLSNMGPV